MPTAILYIYLFFFNDTATTEIYTLSLHDALPICALRPLRRAAMGDGYLLRREPGRYRADPALMLPAHETRDDGLAGGGARGPPLRHYRCCAGRSRTGLHRPPECRCPVLRVALPRTPVHFHDALAPCRRTAPRGGRWQCARWRHARQAPGVLPQGGVAHVRQWPRDRSVPREGPRATDGLAH